MPDTLVLPTPRQIEWANCEIGVLIHYDMPTYVPDYVWDRRLGSAPPAAVFNPGSLSTDQWLEAAVSAGAKYAVLVAKHCSGFCLWPTKVHPYSIGASPWKDGKGDIVGDFIASCNKYGVRPGLYYSANANGYLGMDVWRLQIGDGAAEDAAYPLPRALRDATKAAREAYFSIVLAQLAELWSQYGELFEIWFDGGVIPPEEGGPDIAALLHKLQPNAVVFQGPPGTRSLVRWVGNESGVAAEDCSAVVDYKQEAFDGTEERLYAGNTDGNLWCPGEADMPNRKEQLAFQGGWFWHEGEESYIYPPGELFEKYLTSVGRNTNFLIGMGIDRHGLFPEKDTAAFLEFGRLIKSAFASPIMTLPTPECQTTYTFPLAQKQSPAFLVIEEDVAFGERISAFSLLRAHGGHEALIKQGKIIGHKRIIPLPPDPAEQLVFKITGSKAPARLKRIALY